MEVKEALELYARTKSAWGENYYAFREDVRFSIGLDHWRDAEIKRRGQDACMIVPILPQFIHQVVNDMRQNTPAINVIPAEGKGSAKETAEVLKGLIRNIEYKSGADAVYDTGGEYAVRGGFGFARVDHDYVDDKTELQELKIIRCNNPEAIMLDPSYTECDGSDAKYGFILDTLSLDEFKKQYPGKEAVSFTDTPEKKFEDKEVTIAELFILERVDNGTVGKRKLTKTTVRRYKFSGTEKLEESWFPGKYVPIIPFHGEEVWVEGKRHLLSLIRLAKDAQRRLNKWASKESELLDMAPIAPVTAPMGAVEDFMDEWGKQGEVNVMRYKMFDAAGNKLDKPERLAPPPIPTGIINAQQGAKENVKEAIGMYSANLGQRSNAVSGIAYNAQKQEGDVATFHFSDNRNRSIQHIGRVLACAIPEIYDTPRVIRIIGAEDEPQMVGINGEEMQEAQEVMHDLREGAYDVRILTGASYTTKRQETAALMTDVVTRRPEMMNIIGDLMFKYMDIAGADAISARLKKLLPPQLADDNQDDPQVIQMQQALQQKDAQMQELMQAFQQVQAELQNKNSDHEIKMAELTLKDKELALKGQEIALKYQPQSNTDEMLVKHELDEQAADNQLQREMYAKEHEAVLNPPMAEQPQQIGY